MSPLKWHLTLKTLYSIPVLIRGWMLNVIICLSLQVSQGNVPGVESASLAMDTEEGVEVVWNEVLFHDKKVFKTVEVKNKILFKCPKPFGVERCFKRSLLCSLRLYSFDQKHSKNCNILS